MPERHNKVIYYSLSMPRYVFMVLSIGLFVMAFAMQALAQSGQTQNPTYYNSAEQLDPVHQLIENHVSAIRSRDPSQAYRLISLHGQEKYGTPKLYWRDVRQNMRLLFNHNSYKFMGRNTVNGMIIQKVNMIDQDGKENLVIFRVLQDNENSWRIENIIITSPDEAMA